MKNEIGVCNRKQSEKSFQGRWEDCELSASRYGRRGVCPDSVLNPLQGLTKYGWHFEQEIYAIEGIARALKAGGGSGNIPKIVIYG